MGIPHPPELSLLFISLLYSLPKVFFSVRPSLIDRFGDILLESDEYPWSHSSYYDGELGTPVLRRIIFFGRQFDPLFLPDVKLETNAMESLYEESGKRKINIDPGYIMRSRVVLASAKDYSHRMYLGRGIYGEVALFYKGNQFNPLPYTYYDYREPRSLALFQDVRDKLKRMERIR